MNTYETVAGSTPDVDEQHEPRTVQHTRPDGSVHMMTEIGDGIFVAWATCRTCSKQVPACTCKGGPVEAEYMSRWRDERFTKSFDRRGVEPALPAALRHRDRRVAAVIRFLLARGYRISAPGEEVPWGTFPGEEPVDDVLADLDLREDGPTETSQPEGAVDEGLNAALEKMREHSRPEDFDAEF